MLHPKYDLQIGAVQFKPESSNEIISLIASSSMDSASDTFEGTFGSKGLAAGITKGDSVKISLGYEDGMSQVFQGKIESMNLRTFDLHVTAYSGIFALCNLRKDKFYEQRTAGQIVKDIANMGKVQSENIEDGVKFPYYSLDSNKNGYEHVQTLARTCGFDTYCNSKDMLVFKKYKPIKKHTLNYGKNILRISRMDCTNIYDGVTVIGESPASVSGPETSHWLKKGSMRSFAGSPDKAMYIVNSAIKDEKTAKKIAEDTLNSIKGQLAVVIDLVGDPMIMLGDAVTVGGVPNNEMNGEYQVRSIEHYFNKREGFITAIKGKGKSINEQKPK